jgi:CRISPR system Cascade subunit CasE
MTIWLTSITMDRRHPAVRHDLRDAVDLHRRVMTLLPDGLGADARRQAGVLYRLETTRTGPRLLVQSLLEPEVAFLPEGYGTTRTGRLDHLIDRLRPGVLVRYRIAANASLRRPRGWTGPGKPGQVVALRGARAEEWWSRRAEQLGLELRSAVARPLPDARGRRDGTEVRHSMTQFDGIAVVGDPAMVEHAVQVGVGRGKAYGCGLLSLLLAPNVL